MIFMANRLFEQSREITQERLQREAALQWWGLTVGLKSFDDAWISQGLAGIQRVRSARNRFVGRAARKFTSRITGKIFNL
jgi:hypothetical protein